MSLTKTLLIAGGIVTVVITVFAVGDYMKSPPASGSVGETPSDKPGPIQTFGEVTKDAGVYVIDLKGSGIPQPKLDASGERVILQAGQKFKTFQVHPDPVISDKIGEAVLEVLLPDELGEFVRSSERLFIPVSKTKLLDSEQSGTRLPGPPAAKTGPFLLTVMNRRVEAVFVFCEDDHGADDGLGPQRKVWPSLGLKIGFEPLATPCTARNQAGDEFYPILMPDGKKVKEIPRIKEDTVVNVIN